MAGSKIKGINIKIGADTTGLDTALKNIEKSGKNVTSELGEIRRAMGQNQESVILWQQKQEVLTKAIENSKEKTNLLLQAQKGIEQAFRDGDIDRQAYDKFHEKLRKATDKLNELKNQQEDFKNKLNSGEIGQEEYDKFINKVQKAQSEVQALENSQRSMEENVRLKTVSEEQYRAFQREIENSQRRTHDFESQLAEASARVEELGNRSDDSAEDVDELGNEIQESGEQAENSANGGYSVLGNVFANVITEGIKLAWTALKDFTRDVVATGEEYESAISNVVAISGAMSEEVEMLQEKAEEMGATTKFTASESAEAMGYMAMAGWKVNDMVSGLDGIMDLSSASGESLASVADIVTDALTAFGLQAGDSARFADVLAAASSNANTNVAMMGETFKYTAPVAGALGFSVEDTAEAIGLMANSGIKASQAGTSLRTILTNLSHDITICGDAFKSADNEMGKYTVTTTNADGSIRDLGDILADLRIGWEQLTQAEQAVNAANETLAGKNAMSGFLALMNSAPSDIEKLSTAIENADGTAKKMSETMLDNLQGDRTLFESAFDGLKIAVSKELNPALRDIVQYATAQIPKIQKAVEPVTKFVTNAVKNVPKLIENIQKLTPVLSGMATTAVGVATALTMTKVITFFDTQFIPVMTTAGTAVKALFGVVTANPIIAVTVAVGALTAGLIAYKNAQLDVKTETELLIEKHNEEIQALARKREAIEDLNESFYENVGRIETQTDRTKNLWEELDRLADRYGNVQQKDKARAEYILTELNSALGTEYTMTGNQIDNYRTLSAEIDNVIAKKQAEMLLDSYLANSVEMTKQRTEARADYENADKNLDEKQQALDDLENRYKKLTGGSIEEITKELDENKAFATIDVEIGNRYKSDKAVDLAKQIWTARNEVTQAENILMQARGRYEATGEYFEKLDELQEAFSLGQYDRMADIVYREKDLTNATLDESATDAEQRLEIYSENLQKTLSRFELAVSDMKQKSVDELEKDFTDLLQSGAVAGVDPLEVLEQFKPMLLGFSNNGLDISPLVAPLATSGMSPAEAFGDGWKEIFKRQLGTGGSMEEMVRWLNASGYTTGIPQIWGSEKDFIKYIKEQSAQGQDVSYLLEFGLKSGLETSDEFVKVFRANVEKGLAEGWDMGTLLELSTDKDIGLGDEFGKSFSRQMDALIKNGIDIISFIKWAEASGKSVAEAFGENFRQYVIEYMKVDLGRKSTYFDFFYNNNRNKTENLAKRLEKTFAEGGDLSELAKQAQKSGLEIGDVFGSDFMKVIQKQVNDGFDIQELVKWAEESGGDIAEEYSDIYTEIVQKCIDKGFDIEKLLAWGQDSGLSTADTFGKKYSPEAQQFIDRGFNVDSLLDWAREAGISAGKLFGDNFRQYVDMYLDDKRSEFENFMGNSSGLLRSHISNVFSKLPFMADGGFLAKGRAIVAEAGPELLEVMNGGVRVTPLTRSAQNTPVADGGQKIFYSNYTINATIANGYDVARLAEDLETERRRLERGMGK